MVDPRKMNARFKVMVYWLVANCLAALLLVRRPQIENTYWFWLFCIPGVMFLYATYRWLRSLREDRLLR
jgi:hypothetical protein